MMSVNEDKPPITCAVLETHLKSINNIGLKKRRKKNNIKCKQDETRSILTNYNNY